MNVRAIAARKNQRQRSRRRRVMRRRLSMSRLLLLIAIMGGGWLVYRHIQSTLTQPQIVFVLGGEAERERYAAKFALAHPKLPVWISSGAPREYSEWVFSQAGVDLQRLKLDYRAVDTLTNFTTLVDDLEQQGIKKIYLVTSDYHMRRSRMIGEIILGSRGIDFQAVAIPSGAPEEDMAKTLRDGGRAIVWLMTGYTGHERRLGRSRSPKSQSSNPQSPRSQSIPAQSISAQSVPAQSIPAQ